MKLLKVGDQFINPDAIAAVSVETREQKASTVTVDLIGGGKVKLSHPDEMNAFLAWVVTDTDMTDILDLNRNKVVAQGTCLHPRSY